MSDYDVIVIGAGPGGYVCAIRLSQLGLKVACVEKHETLGGTCLNVGCIPSKALLTASEKFESAQNDFASFGIKLAGVKLDFPAMQTHKSKVIEDNTKGIEFLFKKNKVDWLKGQGSIPAIGKVDVLGADGKTTTYNTKRIIIATGSEVATLPNIKIDEQNIISSTGALALEKTPSHMVVIGAGVIGLELGTVYRRLGAKVTVIEYLDRILPGMDAELAKQAQRIFEKQGLNFKLSSKVLSAKTTKKGVTLAIEPASGGKAEEITGDVVLVAVGRKPHTSSLGLENVGVELDERGRIKTNAHFATNIEGIYAIGDAIEGAMLAHKAEDEGVALAEILAGQSPHIDYNLIPSVVYTSPEIASVGKTEEQLKAEGISYKVGKFPYMANGRARSMNATEGFAKVLADSTTDQVLGVHIIGAEAGTMIAEAVIAMEFTASAEDIARTCHAHPTLNEVVKEAALAVDARAIHI